MLRTSSELLRYDVEATDGMIGHVEDLLFDDQSWKVRWIVVDSGSLLEQHQAVIEPATVSRLKFPEETIALTLSKCEVEAAPGLEEVPPVSKQHEGRGYDPHLRSIGETCAYSISASDAKLGRIHGFMIELSSWTIRYLIVDTGEWMMGRLVLLSPHAIETIDWAGRTMRAGVTADAIRRSPVYDERSELSRDYEAFLHDYYGWKRYWP